MAQPVVPVSSPTAPQPARPRMVSIDVFRGLTVALMILVNTAGDGDVSYAQLRHSAWNGCTLTDLVFPTFLFLMGVSMAIARSAKTPSAAERFAKASRRSAVLILIGLTLNALPFFHLHTLRYCGVMQRIGLTYWLAAIFLLCIDWRGTVALCCLILGGYWAVMTVVPIPGIGKTGTQAGILDPVANMAAALDRLAIPQAHLYRHSFYDPEGLLSTLPALASVLLGVLAGRVLQRRELASRLGWLAGCGVGLATLGLMWNAVFPINKRMWTSSYVLWVAGIDFLLLALLSRWLDRPAPPATGWRQRLLPPWQAFGSNALVAYVLSEIIAIAISTAHVTAGVSLQRWSYLLIPAWAGPPPLRSLVWSVAFTALCYLPVHLLYRKRIFIKL